MNETAVRAGGERRSSMCPDCRTVRGTAIGNAVGHGVQTISYRCPTCGRRWEHAYPEKSERRIIQH